MLRVTIVSLFTFFIGSLLAQNNEEFPNVELETSKDRIINSSSFKLSQHPKVVVFWVTTSRSAIEELNALQVKKGSWGKEFDAQIISIALDNTKQKKKVVPFIRSNGWTFDCYLDPSAKTMIAIEGKDVPLTLILDETGKIVWKQEGFNSSTINQIQEVLTKMTEI